MNETLELFQRIAERTKVDGRWQNPQYLADLLLELTSYYSSLGDVLADAKDARERADDQLKRTREKIKLAHMKEGASGTKADSLKVVETKEESQTFLEASYRYDKIKSYRENLEKTMDAIRTRISYAKYEIEGNRTGI